MLGPPASAVLARDLYNQKVLDAICMIPIGHLPGSATGLVCRITVFGVLNVCIFIANTGLFR